MGADWLNTGKLRKSRGGMVHHALHSGEVQEVINWSGSERGSGKTRGRGCRG